MLTKLVAVRAEVRHQAGRRGTGKTWDDGRILKQEKAYAVAVTTIRPPQGKEPLNKRRILQDPIPRSNSAGSAKPRISHVRAMTRMRCTSRSALRSGGDETRSRSPAAPSSLMSFVRDFVLRSNIHAPCRSSRMNTRGCAAAIWQ